MATRTISTQLTLDGEQKFKQQMSAVNSELRTLKTEMGRVDAEFQGQANSTEALTQKGEVLRKEIAQQEEKVRALEKALGEAEVAFEGNEVKIDGYRQSLNRAQTELIKMNRQLQDTDKYLAEAKGSADGTASSIDELGRQVKDVDPGDLKGLAGSLGDMKALLAGGAVGLGVGAVKEAGTAILDVVDSTEEYRQIMGTLEASSQQAGYSAEQTGETYSQLYRVLGDNQAAATATANLQAIGLEQDVLTQLTDASIGAWARYGDSIPIDQMAESINLAAQQGEVSGALADAIEWAGGNVEDFEERLLRANDAEQRGKIILQELKEQGLLEAAAGWEELNEDVIEGNEAQQRMEEAMGKLGEVLSPVASDIRNFGADSIEWLAGKLEDLLGWIGNVMDKWQEFSGKMRDNRMDLAAQEQQAYDAYRASVEDTTPVWERGTTGTSAGRGGYGGAAVSTFVSNVTLEMDGDVLAQKQVTANRRQATLQGPNMVDNY